MSNRQTWILHAQMLRGTHEYLNMSMEHELSLAGLKTVQLNQQGNSRLVQSEVAAVPNWRVAGPVRRESPFENMEGIIGELLS